MPKEEKYLDASKGVGDYYVSLINYLTGKGEIDQSSLSRLEGQIRDRLTKLTQRAKDGFEQQHFLASVRGLNAPKMLQQVTRFRSVENVELLADTSKYRLEELTNGVFAIYIKPEFYSKLRPGAAGVAVKIKDGVSFIMIPEYDNPAVLEKELKENIPHETHHLAWNFAQGGVITTDEQNSDFAKAFLMYQDEVMAKLCSNGGLTGYTHLAMLDPETRQQFEQEHPETAKQLTEITIFLNNLLEEIDELRRKTDVRKQDLIMAVMTAKTFEGLKLNLLTIKRVIERQPVAQEGAKDSSGWDFI